MISYIKDIFVRENAFNVRVVFCPIDIKGCALMQIKIVIDLDRSMIVLVVVGSMPNSCTNARDRPNVFETLFQLYFFLPNNNHFLRFRSRSTYYKIRSTLMPIEILSVVKQDTKTKKRTRKHKKEKRNKRKKTIASKKYDSNDNLTFR